MSPNEPMPTLESNGGGGGFGAVRTASTITLLAAIWFFISPWVYGAYGNMNAWNSWIVGAVIGILAIIRLSGPGTMPGLSWFNACLGVWAFFSPWIYGYTGNTGRMVNSLCVGVVVFVLAIVSATITNRGAHHHHLPAGGTHVGV
jgi:hypothetical protein